LAQFNGFGAIGSYAGAAYDIYGMTAGVYDLSARPVVGLRTLFGSSAADTLRGDSLANGLNGQAGNDRIEGLGGDDSVSGGDGNDIVLGGEGGDSLSGGNGNDWLDGDGGNDSFLGDAGADTLIGGAGADRLDGGNGNDSIVAGLGDDTIVLGGTAVDTIAGGEGQDMLLVNASANISGVSISSVETLAIASPSTAWTQATTILTAQQFAGFGVIQSGKDRLFQLTGENAGRYDLSARNVTSLGLLMDPWGMIRSVVMTLAIHWKGKPAMT